MSELESMQEQLEKFSHDYLALRGEIAKAIVGCDEIVDGLLAAVITGQHILIEGTPGLGKTAVVEALVDSLQLSYQRIQFTSDLLPVDLLGTHVVMEDKQGRRTFEFQQGPIFSQLILADQINRGLPKTQAALLEAMEGGQVSVSRETLILPTPFIVAATANPHDSEGTFPLPEAQLDRFLMKVVAKTPPVDEFVEILDRTCSIEAPPVATVISVRRTLEMRDLLPYIEAKPEILQLVAKMVTASHPESEFAPEKVKRYVRLGASPRAGQAILAAARVRAAVEMQTMVQPKHIAEVAMAALRHRIFLNFAGQADGVSVDDIVASLFEVVKG